MKKDDPSVSPESSPIRSLTIREALIKNGAKEDDLYPEAEIEDRFKQAILACLSTPKIKTIDR